MAERGKFNLQVNHIQHGHLLMHHRVPNPSRKTAEVWPVDVAQGFPMDLDWGGMEVFAAIFYRGIASRARVLGADRLGSVQSLLPEIDEYK